MGEIIYICSRLKWKKNHVGAENPFLYIREKNIIQLILLTAFFALVFINIYKPFSSSNWYAVSEFMYLVYSSLIILTGVLVVVISRVILYYRGQKKGISLGVYFIWILAEVFFMSLFYTIYTLALNREREYMEVFEECALNTGLVLFLPYAVIHLYFSYQDKKNKLKALAEERAESVPRQEVYAFYDEKNELCLSVRRENFLYIESADNYVHIWYLNKNRLTKFMLRNSLKTIEESLADTPVLRCHRSYMVNSEQVKVLKRRKEGIYMEFGMENVPDIPVSKTYSEKVTHWFVKYSS